MATRDELRHWAQHKRWQRRRQKSPYEMGRDAAWQGLPLTNSPYPSNDSRYAAQAAEFLRGWNDQTAEDQQRRKK